MNSIKKILNIGTNNKMKKTCTLIIGLLFSIVTFSFSQSTPAKDFFAGKWEISISGTPRGDVQFLTNLERKEGKLTGELTNPLDTAEKRPITKVEDTATKMLIYFMSSQGGEISIELDKVDENTLKGTLMGYETNARRRKE